VTDPYEIAITTYALTLCDSMEKEFAFSLLHSKRLEVAGMMEFGCKQNTNQDFPTVNQMLPFFWGLNVL
jgi:hypothetical protein